MIFKTWWGDLDDHEDPPEKRCEQCKFYGFIDSAYGYCMRYPPKSILVKTNFFINKGNKYDTQYPVVTWHTPACGEYALTEKGRK